MNRGRERPITIALGWRLPGWLLDLGPVAFIAFIGLGGVAFAHRHTNTARGLLLAAVLVAAGSMLVRHRVPLAALAAVLVISVGIGYGPVVVLPVMLGVFTVAEYSRRSHLAVAVATTALALVVMVALHGPHFNLQTIISNEIAVGLAAAVGLYVRTRADYITGLRERAERLEREQELLAAQAVAEERVRIARELHDVVAHNVSLMVVQAQALAVTGGHADAPATLHRVADLGRDALSEMHRMLGVLRIADGEAAQLEPQPGVRDLDRLVARTCEAGLNATLAVQGTPRPLPAAVDLSVYRIAQEALTNVVRHASASHAEVTLSYTASALELTVRDDGIGVNGHGPTFTSGGHGLVGMRERVALFGGDLQAGRADAGSGYLVRALLPTP